MARLIVQELDGKKVAYHGKTNFYVQVGRYAKGSYKPRYHIVGSLTQAVMYFNCINIGLGYKKRLQMENKTLARSAS